MAARVALSINSALVDKPSDRDRSQYAAHGWEACNLTIEQWMSSVAAGHAYAPQYRGGHRKGSNFACSGFLAADFDGGITIQEARDHPFINAFASFTYTTASHTPEANRFRVNFRVESPIEDGQSFADANLALAVRLGADTAATDKARCYFGNRTAEFFVLGHALPDDRVAELITAGKEFRLAHVSQLPVDSVTPINGDAMVRAADGVLALLRDLPLRTSIYCESHDDRRPSAFVVRSDKSNSVGYHCRRCRRTFWARNDAYNFKMFDAFVVEKQAKPLPVEGPSSIFDEFLPPNPSCIVTQDRFLAPFDYKRGVTLVKSPKGSGKTVALKRLVDQIRTTKPKNAQKLGWPKRVLVIGHRRALLREMAAKLDVLFYLEHGGAYSQNPDCLAVCLDSLPAYTEPYVSQWRGREPVYRQDPAFDLVIIDECEQVFSHLVGGTIAKKQGGVDSCYDALLFQISQAKAVVLCDADLGMLTAHVMKYARPQDWDQARIIYNKPVPPEGGRALQLFESEIALREELIGAIQRGERCFVTSNSKKAVNVLREIIVKRVGKGVKLRVITSENSRDASEIEFVNNIRDEFLKLQVIICSPSLGTGIDITYPDPEGKLAAGLCKVDHVFGFFYPKVNTHTDMDQQLWRVRNPGSVKVWISPARFQFSSSFDVIKDDLARARYVPRAVQGYDQDGLTKYDPFNPLLMIYTHVIASQRESKNRLIELFCELREAQGWTIEHVTKRILKNEDRKEAERKIWNEQANALLAAPHLDDHDFFDLTVKEAGGDPLTVSERVTFERNRLERSLGTFLTYDIIKLNYDNSLLDRVEVLAVLIQQSSLLHRFCVECIEEQRLPLSRIPKIEPIAVVALALTISGFMNSEGIQQDAIVTAAQLGPFIDLCRRNQTNLERLLGQKVRDDVATNPIRQLNVFLRLAGLKVGSVRRTKSKGQTVRMYGLDQAKLPVLMSLAAAFQPPKEVVAELKRLRREKREAAA